MPVYRRKAAPDSVPKTPAMLLTPEISCEPRFSKPPYPRISGPIAIARPATPRIVFCKVGFSALNPSAMRSTNDEKFSIAPVTLNAEFIANPTFAALCFKLSRALPILFLIPPSTRGNSSAAFVICNTNSLPLTPIFRIASTLCVPKAFCIN